MYSYIFSRYLTLPSIWSQCFRKVMNVSTYSTLRKIHCLVLSPNIKSIHNKRNISTGKHKFMSTTVLDVNTKVAKDVILFKYENPKFFRILNIFALSQFGFWAYLSHFAFTSLKDAPSPKDSDNTPWWRKINLGENKYRNGISVLSFLVGYGILTVAWLFTLRSVRYLILRKGGDQVTLVTYTPFGKNRMLTVDVNKVSSQETRHNARVQLPIKVKGHHLFYVLDMRGEFSNPKLFDSTAGLRRTWN
ncbi:hypothetical protein L9F63_007227 [Diploptera punctata]|uniref:Transmembrane protein 223 n=1 Tax=Diploptera punctata TaxID=6984 RepID=A0AAD7Z842_DIPPU|nr:hypothetical protein L9F63_007227 [Diploptera punctata]